MWVDTHKALLGIELMSSTYSVLTGRINERRFFWSLGTGFPEGLEYSGPILLSTSPNQLFIKVHGSANFCGSPPFAINAENFVLSFK